MRSFRLFAAALFALALFGAPVVVSAQSFTDTQRSDIETIIKNYLVSPSGSAGRGDDRAHQAPDRGRSAEARGEHHQECEHDLQLAARRHARQQGRRRHLRRVLRLQLRLLQARHDRHARPHEERPEAEGRAEGVSGAERRLGRRRQGRGRRAHAGSDGPEISRLPPEAARRPRSGRQGARDGRRQGGRPRHRARSRRICRAPRSRRPSRRTSSSPRTWA